MQGRCGGDARSALDAPTPRQPGMKARGPAARPESFSSFAQSRVERWHWPLLLLSTAIAATAVIEVINRDRITLPWRIKVHMQPHSEQMLALTNLEQQLAGCRTTKSDPIPVVDKSPSLSVLDSHTPEQRRQAQEFTAAVGACTDFACLRKANQLPRAPGQFRFPHFLVLGFPKCATTSIYCHLIQHPQVQHPRLKEPHLLTDKCRPQLSNCSAEAQRQYLLEVLNLEEAAAAQFTRAAFEGSTHAVQESHWLPAELSAAFPWVRLAVSMREPISQAIAMLLHNIMHNRDLRFCTSNDIFHCVRRELKSRACYSCKLRQWISFFPRDKLHILQYEAMTSQDAMQGVLANFKTFLGVDQRLPSDNLPLTNWKHQRGGPDELGKAWSMQRYQYEVLVDMARNDTLQMLGMLAKHGIAVTDAQHDNWLRRWERIWEDNLASCGSERSSPCRIVVS